MAEEDNIVFTKEEVAPFFKKFMAQAGNKVCHL